VTRLTLATALMAALATPAFAQVVETPTDTQVFIPPGAPGLVTRQTNSTGGAGGNGGG